MISDGFIIRQATIGDVPFLVDTIVEAEKSGTDKLSYSSIFGLSEDDVKLYLADMLYQGIDGCELSVSSFLVAEKDGRIAAAVSAWIEGSHGVPSSVLKGNLLTNILPRESIEKASLIKLILRDMHIGYIQNSIQIGAGYVAKEFRGNNLLGILNDEIIERLSILKPDVSEVYVQIFSCNSIAININKKSNFKVILIKESLNYEILRYLPSNKKVLMKKELSLK